MQCEGHIRFTQNSDRESGLAETVTSALSPEWGTCSVHWLMSALGQKRTFRAAIVMSAFPFQNRKLNSELSNSFKCGLWGLSDF